MNYKYLIVLFALIFLTLPIFAQNCSEALYLDGATRNLIPAGGYTLRHDTNIRTYNSEPIKIKEPIATKANSKIIVYDKESNKICEIKVPSNSVFHSFIYKNKKYVLGVNYLKDTPINSKYFNLFIDKTYPPKNVKQQPVKNNPRPTLKGICKTIKTFPQTLKEESCEKWGTYNLTKNARTLFHDIPKKPPFFPIRLTAFCITYKNKDYCNNISSSTITNYDCNIENTKIYLSINPTKKQFCVHNQSIKCKKLQNIPKNYSLLMPKLYVNLESNKIHTSSLGYRLTYKNKEATISSTRLLTKELNPKPHIINVTLNTVQKKEIYICTFPDKQKGTFDKIFVFYPKDQFEIYDQCGQEICETNPTICSLSDLPTDITKYKQETKNLKTATGIYDKEDLKYNLFYLNASPKNLCVAQNKYFKKYHLSSWSMIYKKCFSFDDLEGQAIKCTGNLSQKEKNGTIYFKLTDDKKGYIIYSKKEAESGNFWKMFFTRLYKGIFGTVP